MKTAIYSGMTSRNQKKPPKTGAAPRRKRSWLIRLIGYGLALTVWGTVGLAGIMAWYAYDLPDIENLERAAGKRAPTVTVKAADGTVLAHYGELYGVAVQLHELPPHLPHAVLAVEDRRFYDHMGVDPIGILRAGWVNLWAGTVRSGGSTISQQLAKNLFLSSDRTVRRKVQELLLAFWLEQRFGKDQILTIYLNRVYFGQGAYGVDAAARRYFNKPAAQVTAYEAAMLAGLLKAPSRYNPLTNPDLAAGRATQVLQSMVEAGWLSKDQAAAAKSGRAVMHSDRLGGQSRHFADWVLDRAQDYISHDGGDLIIHTTLDPRLQRLAESAVAKNLVASKKRKASQAAMVAMRPDGAIVAMVGGASYGASQFNRATQALRQPGSSFKLFVYLTAFESGFRPGDEVEDAPITIDGWSPRNYGGKYRGTVSIRESVARSLNSVAASIAERVGRTKVTATARRLGITSPIGTDPALALGAYEVTLLEMTSAYAVMANGGIGVWPHGITEVSDGEGNILFRRSGGGPGRVVEPEHVAAVNDVLTAAITWGTGKQAKLDRPSAGKTGTSQDSRDAWFIGYTADLITGVWFGNDNNSAMDDVGGGSFPARTWRAFMKPAHEGVAPKPLPGVAAPLSN
ncbi:MAG: PBP1A family penicillin-binding protein [Alphaproteobacteria bacterium]|nr:PBP1A family penicillin-binding protein [Alphaproteobacteria bacterium]